MGIGVLEAVHHRYWIGRGWAFLAQVKYYLTQHLAFFVFSLQFSFKGGYLFILIVNASGAAAIRRVFVRKFHQVRPGLN